MITKIKLSDKILLFTFFFSSLFIVFAKFVGGISSGRLLIFTCLAYNLIFIVSFFVNKNFIKRLEAITYKLEEMAAGGLSKKLKIKGKDEIAQLATAMNELMSRLQMGIAQDVSKSHELSQAKTDFVTIASHQLRTPLSIIKWYIDFLLNGDAGNVNSEQKKYLEEVYLSNERLIELVNALLDVSRIDLGTFSIEPEPCDLVLMADQAIQKHSAEISRKKIKFKRKYDRLPIMNLDPRLTRIVFENILSNAIKYTPESGMVELVIKKTDKNILIKISDSGYGIPKEQQPKIFTKLFRADNVRKIESVGTGLGLYIVKAVVEKSGGKIWFQSPSLELLLSDGQKESDIPIDKRNAGTTFFITIPLEGMKKKTGTKKLTSADYITDQRK